MFKVLLCNHFNQSKMWLSSPTGIKRLKQCEEMTGGHTQENFEKYQAMGFAYINKVKAKLTYLEIGQAIFKKPEQYRKGFAFINRLVNRVYDDDEFLKVDTVAKLRKLIAVIDKKATSFSTVVCHCKQVTVGEVLHAIKELGAKTLDDVERLTDAGSVCKCCKSFDDDCLLVEKPLHITDILKKFTK